MLGVDRLDMIKGIPEKINTNSKKILLEFPREYKQDTLQESEAKAWFLIL